MSSTMSAARATPEPQNEATVNGRFCENWLGAGNLLDAVYQTRNGTGVGVGAS